MNMMESQPAASPSSISNMSSKHSIFPSCQLLLETSANITTPLSPPPQPCHSSYTKDNVPQEKTVQNSLPLQCCRYLACYSLGYAGTCVGFIISYLLYIVTHRVSTVSKDIQDPPTPPPPPAQHTYIVICLGARVRGGMPMKPLAADF
jgi:hypothetical protein